MAPIKFEEQIKDTLEKRTLKPSNHAWDRLEEQLDANPKNKKTATFLWIGIAASLVGVFLVANLFLKENATKQKSKSIIVETPVDSSKLNIEPQKNINIVEDEHAIANLDNIEEEKTNNKEVKHNYKKPLENNATGVVVNNTATKEEQVVKQNNKPQDILDIKVKEVVGQIQQLKQQNVAVTEDDIEALLNKAQEELEQQRTYNKNTNTVDAMALLQDVEADLEQSFRDRVFDALLFSYETVKTAVAERND